MKKLLAVIALLFIASACGHEHDMDAIENQIEEEVNASTDHTKYPHINVDCPSSVEWEEDGEFECDAYSLMDHATIIVTMGSDEFDNVRWRVG